MYFSSKKSWLYPIDAVALKLGPRGASFTTMLTVPPMASPSISGVRDLLISMLLNISEGTMSSCTNLFLSSGLAIFIPFTRVLL